ncbi:MAG TPA: glutaminyl-peptide cyclotransferase [Blastocatellia bacterium]|nr:glutaminyl-peptide cyclotransferase [Blastocatellia bacterium]
MAKKSDKKRTRKSAGSSKRSRASIVALGLIAVAGAVFLIVILLRQGTPTQPNTTSNSNQSTSVARAQQVSYEVVSSYPHDPTSFTQGLLWHDGSLYEGTGLEGQSKLRRLEFPSGKVLKEISLSTEYFGEGLALVNNRLIQLTWKSHRGFVYDLDSFKQLQEFAYDTEGWGLTYDGSNLILSDGSSNLFYLDPQTFKPIRNLAVTMNGQPLTEINELEFIEGEIWANVWQTDKIVRIDPSTGRVTSFLNLKGILAPSDRTGREDVLNGIAYDAEKKRIFITGKLWPRIFEIRVIK